MNILTAAYRKITSSKVIEPSAFVRDYLKQLAPCQEVNARIHEDDEMFVFTLGKNEGDRDLNTCSYLETGKNIADSVRQLVKWKFGGFQNVGKLLDFASGYGRVTRFLAQDMEPSRLWVSDIFASAVKFQKANLGVRGFVSASQPDALQVRERFDCILVSSLFTHLPESTFVKWLEKLYSMLAPDGLLIISTHDESLRAGKLHDDPIFCFDEESEIDTLDKKEYGSTVVNEHYVRGAIKEATGGLGCYLRIPKGLNRHQDLYLIAGEPKPDFSTLHYSIGAPGYVEAVSLLQPDLLEVSGWAFDVSGLNIDEVRVVVQDGLIQKCIPALKRPDVAAYFKNPSAELSGFSCVGRLPSNASLLGSAPLTVFAIASGGESFTIYKNSISSALRLRHIRR